MEGHNLDGSLEESLREWEVGDATSEMCQKADLSIGVDAAVVPASSVLSMRQEEGANKRLTLMLYRRF